MEESEVWYHPAAAASCSMEDIVDAVKCEEIFGFIQCSIHVPSHLIDNFSEFPPIFKNTEFSVGNIGEHVQAYCRSSGRKLCVKRSLISLMKGENIILISPLLKNT